MPYLRDFIFFLSLQTSLWRELEAAPTCRLSHPGAGLFSLAPSFSTSMQKQRKTCFSALWSQRRPLRKRSPPPGITPSPSTPRPQSHLSVFLFENHYSHSVYLGYGKRLHLHVGYPLQSRFLLPHPLVKYIASVGKIIGKSSPGESRHLLASCHTSSSALPSLTSARYLRWTTF